MLEAYHNWRAVAFDTNAHVTPVLNSKSQSTRWDRSKLENLCPTCFNYSPNEINKTAFVSVDGCHQLRRFKDCKDTYKLSKYEEYEKFLSSLFVVLNRRFFKGAREADPEDEEDLITTQAIDSPQGSQCENQFKATRSWESKSGNNKELKSLQPFD